MANYSKATAFLSVAVFLLALVLVHVAESRVLPKCKILLFIYLIKFTWCNCQLFQLGICTYILLHN